MQKYIRFITHYTRNEKKQVFLLIALKAIRTIMAILNPLLYSNVITNLLEKNLQQTMLSFSFLCVCHVVILFLGYLTKVVENKLVNTINYEVKQDLAEKLFSIPPSQLTINQGKMFSLILHDSSVISSTLLIFISALFSVFTILGIGIVVFLIDWKMSLVLLCLYPVNIVINTFFSKRLKHQSLVLVEQNDNYVSLLKNCIANIFDISVNRGTQKINLELIKKNKDVYEASLTKGIIKSFYSITTSAIGMINHLLITLLGIILVLTSRITFGNYVAFISYSKNLSTSMEVIINLNSTLQPAIVSIERLQSLTSNYDNSIHIESQKNLINIPIHSIIFKDVHFSANNRIILKNIHMEFRKGEIIGLLGENASGKTTIANLLLTNIMPTSGKILINDEPNDTFAYKSILQHISYVGSSKNLFNLSIRDNILISHTDTNPNISAVNQICKQLNLKDDIEQLPLKFDTIMSDHIKLSSGQIQKIQLARAFLSNPDVLILDEALSNLDLKTKQQTKDYLQQLKQDGKIIILISHDPDDYNICDKNYLITEETICEFP